MKISTAEELLKLKGDNEFVKINSSTILEGVGNYKSYDYVIVFYDLGHRCGYVNIKDNDNFNVEQIECHGGVTYYERGLHFIDDPVDNNDYWIGFDCAHFNDLKDLDAFTKCFPSERDDYLVTMNSLILNIENPLFGKPLENPWAWKIFADARLWTFSDVENECKNIIDQLQNIKEKS